MWPTSKVIAIVQQQKPTYLRKKKNTYGRPRSLTRKLKSPAKVASTSAGLDHQEESAHTILDHNGWNMVTEPVIGGSSKNHPASMSHTCVARRELITTILTFSDETLRQQALPGPKSDETLRVWCSSCKGHPNARLQAERQDPHHTSYREQSSCSWIRFSVASSSHTEIG